MISAEDARKQKNELNWLKDKQQLSEVEKKINKDIKRGYTYYYEKLADNVANELIQLGYKIEYFSSHRDGDVTTIKW